MDRAKDNLKEILKNNGYSITTPRVEVFELLYKFGLQTMSQLLDRSNSDRASIYRAVELLCRIGVVRQVQFGFKYKLELSDSFLPHHHHITCLVCGKNADFSSPRLEQLLTELAQLEGFLVESHIVELNGMCSQCRNVNQSPSEH